MEKVSVIVPVYNVEKYLERCVISILNQSYRNIELILVDDGSTDESKGICDRYLSLDDRTRVIHIQNAGVSNARNIGINLSTGKYIAFVDSDDHIASDLIDNMCQNIDKYDCDMIAINSYYVEKINNTYTVPTNYHGLYSEEEIDLIIGNIIDYESRKNVFFSSVCSKLFAKEIIINNQIEFKTNVKMAEDTLFVIEYLSYCRRIYCINAPGYFYVQHQNSSTSKQIDVKNKWYNYKTFVEELVEVISNSKFSSMLPAAHSTYLTCMNTTIIYAINKNSKNYFGVRPEIIGILGERSYRRILDEIKFKKLNKIKKKQYIIQKYYLIDFIALKEGIKNILRPFAKK